MGAMAIDYNFTYIPLLEPCPCQGKAKDCMCMGRGVVPTEHGRILLEFVRDWAFPPVVYEYKTTHLTEEERKKVQEVVDSLKSGSFMTLPATIDIPKIKERPQDQGMADPDHVR